MSRAIFSKYTAARSGQSLLEVIVGLGIGGLLIGAGAFAISAALRANFTIQRSQGASGLNQELMDKVRGFSAADWQNIYGLAKGATTTYFIAPSGSTFLAVPGIEGVLENDIMSGLVGYWKFDEATSTASPLTYDESGRGNAGTLNGGASRATSTCRVGSCLTYNGVVGSWTSVPHSPVLDFSTSSFTVTVWVKNIVASADRSGIVAKETNWGPNTGWWLGAVNPSNAFAWQIDDNVTQVGRVGTGNLNDGVWHFLALVVDRGSNTMTGYNNLVALGDSIAAVGDADGGDTLAFGSFSGGVRQIAGLIDDARIYNRALSASELQQLYNSNVLTRFFSVENVCRTNDAASTIVGPAPCGGGSADDASTQYVTTYTQWQASNKTGQVQASDFFTRWSNSVSQQSDWSGGAGSAGPYTNPSNVFATSSGIDVTSGGGLRIHGL